MCVCGGGVYVYVCVCVREREREVCVCVCVVDGRVEVGVLCWECTREGGGGDALLGVHIVC